MKADGRSFYTDGPPRPQTLARAVLIITIITMVLVSIHPFASRKIFLLAVALLGLSSALCFADPVFMARKYAPSRDQKRPARPEMAPQANREEPSSIWRSFERSAVRFDDISPDASLALCGDANRAMVPDLPIEVVATFPKTPISCSADLDSRLAVIALARVQTAVSEAP